MASTERDLMGYDGKKSWVTLDLNDDNQRTKYFEWEDSVAQMKNYRSIKKRVQGYVSRYLKQADENLYNISRGSLDPP
jgi:hypothetical protein